MIRTYRDLRKLKTFHERFDYLKLGGRVGEATFGYDRYLNQMLYSSDRWKSIRDDVIIRDNGCDLGIEGHDIYGGIWIHHMNPLTPEEIESGSDDIYDPEYLICTARNTHDAVHYRNVILIPKEPIVRYKNDTCPWR